MNILPYNNSFYGTPLEEWPQKPTCEHYLRDNVTIGPPIKTCIHCGKTDSSENFYSEQHYSDTYEKRLAKALTHCIPIVEEDWEKVRMAFAIRFGVLLVDVDDELHDSTIYKDTSIELEEVGQYKGDEKYGGGWVTQGNIETHEWLKVKFPHFEYRKAYRVKK